MIPGGEPKLLPSPTGLARGRGEDGDVPVPPVPGSVGMSLAGYG